MELCLQTYQGQMETRRTLQKKHLEQWMQLGGCGVGMEETQQSCSAEFCTAIYNFST